MIFCEEIKKNEVLKTALKLIGESQKTINMTMNMADELTNPLPAIYHRKLLKLIQKNIKIDRIVFGPKKLFKKITDKYPEINIKYGGDLNKYQRFLIIDKKMGIFSLNGHVFFSQYEPLIKSLLEYVKIYK